MSYFTNFPNVYYRFGNEENFNIFKNISAYVDIIDQVKEDSTFYTLYNLKDGERPDTLSQDLYGTTDYYWTFFHLNDNLKRYGWPIDIIKVPDFTQKKYPNTTVITYDYFYDKFNIGERLEGSLSGTVGTIVDKISDFGQIVLKGQLGFLDGETLFTKDRTFNVTSVVIQSSFPEYDAPHHFIRDGKRVDIDPTMPIGSEIVPVTNTEYYTQLNEERKVIKVFRRNAIQNIFAAFNQALKENVIT
jgi:hypothetical protein